MPGGLFGPSSSGNVTQTTTNPSQAAQLPFLQGGWQAAASQAQNNPLQYYPGTTYVPDPAMQAGYQALRDTSGSQQPLVSSGSNAFLNGVNGGFGVTNSPAYPGYSTIASGNNPQEYNVDNLTGALSGVGNGAQNAGIQFGSQIAGAANTAPGSVAPYTATLASNAATAPLSVGGAVNQTARNASAAYLNPALASLTAEANGAYLGKNPYIAGEFNAAAQPVINAYQTATAPQTDSNFEAAGRYGSGALANARSQNEQNLGTTLGNLSANLYGQDYANERNLQTQAGSQLGSIFTGDVNASTNAAGTGGGLALGGINASTTAANAGGNLALGGVGQQLAGLGAAAGATNAGYNTGANALSQGGALSLGNLSAENAALGGLQTGYQAGNNSTLQSLLLEPSVLNSQTVPAQTTIAGGQGLTGLNQAQLQDLENRFYGNQQAPWQNIDQFLNAVGQPLGGSSITTSPLLGPSLASSAVGGGLGALQLANGLGNSGLFGGALSGLAGSTGAGDMGLLGALGGNFGGGGDLAAAASAGGGGILDGIGSLFGGLFA